MIFNSQYHWWWVGSIAIISPYFCGDGLDGAAVTVNTVRYVEMLRNFLEPELRNRGIYLNTIWFQEGGATDL
jgi:hypothetical protein